jgi:transcriptional regulator of arginine metabolism
MSSLDLSARLQALRGLLARERTSTQDELREEMDRLGFAVNQSTVSRDLRRVGAIKVPDVSGRTGYRLPGGESASPPTAVRSLGALVRSVRHNGAMIVILTDPGSASLVARHIDGLRSDLIAGSIAGDDAVFVAPSSIKTVAKTSQMIEDSLR